VCSVCAFCPLAEAACTALCALATADLAQDTRRSYETVEDLVEAAVVAVDGSRRAAARALRRFRREMDLDDGG
jgi:hypothetical protein